MNSSSKLKITRLISISLAITLASCGPSKKEQLAVFDKDCQTAFTAAQCRVLASMYGASLDAQESADTASALGAAGFGFAATSGAIAAAGRK